MTIKEACEKTGLTRKAVRYYESAGLISPEIDPNGYRNYSDQLILRLNVIAVLRGFRLSIDEIRECLSGEEALSKTIDKKLIELEKEKNVLSTELQLLGEFRKGERSLEEISSLRKRIEASLRDRPGYLSIRLRQLFPGDFGEILSALYGNMLDANLETQEQYTAWISLVNELDAISPVEVPDDVAEWARQRNKSGLISDNLARMQEEYSADYNTFSQKKREAVDMYLSDENLKKELHETSKQSKIVAGFLAGPGSQINSVIEKYLHILSSAFNNFAEKLQLFIQDNPDYINRLESSGS